MPLAGVDDQGAYIDTGEATLSTARPPQDVELHTVKDIDSGATARTVRPTRKAIGGQR